MKLTNHMNHEIVFGAGAVLMPAGEDGDTLKIPNETIEELLPLRETIVRYYDDGSVFSIEGAPEGFPVGGEA